MMVAAGNKSGVGRLTHLHAFVERAINDKPASVVMGASRSELTISRYELNMTRSKIARQSRARKWHTEYSPHKIPVNIHNAKRRLACEVQQ